MILAYVERLMAKLDVLIGVECSGKPAFPYEWSHRTSWDRTR